MADGSSNYLCNSRNNRDRGKEKYKDRNPNSPRKKYDVDNTRSNKDSSSKPYDRKFEDRNAHHSSKHWEDRRARNRPNNKTHSPSPLLQRFKHEPICENFPVLLHNDTLPNGNQRSSHNVDRYNDRVFDEPRLLPYNNHKSDVNRDDELIACLEQKVDNLIGQVEFFYQENEKLKYDFHNVNNHVRGGPSSSEVNIIFRDKKLERQFLPILEELVAEIISQNIGLEDLEEFLSSKRKSVEDDLPEGELFALDNSTSEPNEGSHIPCYETSFSEILQDQDLMNEVDAKKDKPSKVKTCFNCSGDHMLHDCPYQMDYRKVAMARKQRSKAFVPQVRYHVQGMKERDLKPGTISDELREALQLGPDQIPPFIYHMRVLNYPPGWLAEAEVETSGITLYGTDVQTDENTEAGKQNFESRVQYDPDKLIDFPGFNVPLPTNFNDEFEGLCWPPLQDCHLRSVVEQQMPKLELPKRKRKLTLPVNQTVKVQRLEEDMEVEETLENGSLEFNPPLPEENPPPPPPDEPLPPLPEEEPLPPLPEDEPKPPPSDEFEIYTIVDSDEDSGTNTPMSASIMETLAPVVERYKRQNNEINESAPSLKDLEEIKKRLVMELGISDEGSSDVNQYDSEPCFSQDTSNDLSSLGSESNFPSRQLSKTESCPEAQSSWRQVSVTESQDSGSENPLGQVSLIENQGSGSEDPNLSKKILRSDSHCSGSKLVSLGTPSLSRHSSFRKLPDYDNFSKNVTTHLNFENLPNSVGTYQKMKKVIKKVKEKIHSFMQ